MRLSHRDDLRSIMNAYMNDWINYFEKLIKIYFYHFNRYIFQEVIIQKILIEKEFNNY